MTENFTTAFSVDRSPEDVFAAIKNVPAWWSEIEGTTDEVGGEFLYQVADIHRCTIRVTELIPGRRVVWLILENSFNFTSDETEWTGTEVHFDISRNDGRTEVRFEHVGLIPEYECFEICSSARGGYINGSLRSLIENVHRTTQRQRGRQGQGRRAAPAPQNRRLTRWECQRTSLRSPRSGSGSRDLNPAPDSLGQALALDLDHSAPSIGIRIFMASACPTPVGRAINPLA